MMYLIIFLSNLDRGTEEIFLEIIPTQESRVLRKPVIIDDDLDI